MQSTLEGYFAYFPFGAILNSALVLCFGVHLHTGLKINLFFMFTFGI